MKKSQVRATVYRAVSEIQSACGRTVPKLHGGTKPFGDLEGFDSLNCVEISCQISSYLGCNITKDVGLFAVNGQPRTLDEVVEDVCQMIGAEGD
ncbi:MAG: hypothetical protein HZC41_13100 [Chloroflexi bacterium]|nr:hypothetical protein [Chloroflexota bacterium]